MKPFFSLILPTFNVQDFIQQCLLSILSQDFKDFEILIIDDLGSDDSIKIVKTVKDDRINIYHNEKNLGTFASRNQGALKAKGKYLLFIDPDDTLEQNALSKIYNALTNEPCICAFNYLVRKNDEKFYNNLYKNNDIFDKRSFQRLILSAKKATYNSLCTLAVKKRDVFLQALNIVDKDLRILIAEDVLMVFLCLISSRKIATLNKFLYSYRINSKSISQRQGNVKLSIDNHLLVLSLIKNISKDLSYNDMYFANCVYIDIKCTLINILRQKHKVFYRLSSSLYKKFLRMLRSFYLSKI